MFTLKLNSRRFQHAFRRFNLRCLTVDAEMTKARYGRASH